MTRRKVAIVGYTEHRQFAPFGDDGWEIWGLNDLYYELPEVSVDRLRWFQLHSWNELTRHSPTPVTASPLNFQGGPPHPRDPNHVPWLADQAQRMPVYMLEPRPEVPAARVYPIQDAMQFFSIDGRTPMRYFTNTISYMVALAIMEGFQEIGIWGVDMMMGGGAGSEYGWQRPSCEFFIGFAAGKGAKVYIPEESDLLKCAFPYGYSEGNAFRKKLDSLLTYYQQRRAEAQGMVSQGNAANSELTGGISTLQHLLSSWMPGDSENQTVGRVPVPNSHKGVRSVAPQLEDLPLPSRIRASEPPSASDPGFERAVMEVVQRYLVPASDGGSAA